MSFDDVARNLRRMTSSQIGRHAEPRLDRIELRGVDGLHGEPRLLQVPHPAGAAAAVRILVDGDFLRLRGPDIGRRQRGDAGHEHEGRPSRQRAMKDHGLISLVQRSIQHAVGVAPAGGVPWPEQR
jgi:hypothetical protein